MLLREAQTQKTMYKIFSVIIKEGKDMAITAFRGGYCVTDVYGWATVNTQTKATSAVKSHVIRSMRDCDRPEGAIALLCHISV